MIEIREATEADLDAIWEVFHEVVAAGDSYSFAPDMPREQALRCWTGPGVRTFVAVLDGRVVGTYHLKPNQPGLGSHVANAGFMVASSGRGRGVGRAMAEHALHEAARAGFLAMQFNFVVSTNSAAVALWRKLGFAVVGTVPRAFRHREHGLVDVYVMHRFL
jgi:L-amino acid N-acyltransferase YncA